MNCKYCGAPLPPGKLECKHCGKTQPLSGKKNFEKIPLPQLEDCVNRLVLDYIARNGRHPNLLRCSLATAQRVSLLEGWARGGWGDPSYRVYPEYNQIPYPDNAKAVIAHPSYSIGRTRLWVDILEEPGFRLEITEGISQKVVEAKKVLAGQLKARVPELEPKKRVGFLRRIFGGGYGF